MTDETLILDLDIFCERLIPSSFIGNIQRQSLFFPYVQGTIMPHRKFVLDLIVNFYLKRAITLSNINFKVEKSIV